MLALSSASGPIKTKTSALQPLKFTLTKPQIDIFKDDSRFRIVMAGRRFGKTFLSRCELVTAALSKQNAQVAYIAPTRTQAKQLMWLTLKELLPPKYIRKKEEVDLQLTLINGSQIFLRGAESDTGLRGLGLDFAVFDEAAFMADGVWDAIVRPSLADKQGRALFITTPEIATEWFVDLWDAADSKEDWARYKYTTLEGGNVPASEVESARRDMDPRRFKIEFEASLEALAGRVYYAFDNELNVRSDIVDDGRDRLHIGLDFNVSPAVSTVALRRGSELHVIDEISIMDSNTDIMAKEIKARYPTWKQRGVTCYPDPTGAARKTSAVGGVTDHSILRDHGFEVYSPGAPYPVSTKINTANRAFCDAAGIRRVYFKKGDSTKLLRKAFMGLTFLEGTSVPDPRSNYNHYVDSACYLFLALLPLFDTARSIKVHG